MIGDYHNIYISFERNLRGASCKRLMCFGHNFKLPVFYSRFWSANSSDIDALTVNWFCGDGLFVSLVFLIPRVYNYMGQCQTVGK